jgi:hypothetical protein
MAAKRVVALALVLGIAMLALPAHARIPGPTAVDTWVSIGDRIRGEHKDVGPLGVGATPGSVNHLVWIIENLGGHKPDLKYVTFHGCGDARGFSFRYVAPSGNDVSGRVTHDGYTAHRTLPGEHARLNIWIRSSQRDREYACVLHASGNGREDSVEVWVHS